MWVFFQSNYLSATIVCKFVLNVKQIIRIQVQAKTILYIDSVKPILV